MHNSRLTCVPTTTAPSITQTRWARSRSQLDAPSANGNGTTTRRLFYELFIWSVFPIFRQKPRTLKKAKTLTYRGSTNERPPPPAPLVSQSHLVRPELTEDMASTSKATYMMWVDGKEKAGDAEQSVSESLPDGTLRRLMLSQASR
jgi:hypothetical protein